MTRRVVKLLYCCTILLVLFSDLVPSAQAADDSSLDNSQLDAYTLMVAAHDLLGADLDQLVQSDQSAAKRATLRLADPPSTNPLEIRLRQVQNLCAETRQNIQATYTGAELCEKSAIVDQVCTREITSVQAALERSQRGRGYKTFFRRIFRRLDPARANFGKLFGFIRHEVLPEAAKQIVTGAIGGGNIVARRIIRQTFIRKARQVIKANLTSDLLMSGVPTETIQELGLPAPQEVDYSQIKIDRSIDLQAIRKQCTQDGESADDVSPNQVVITDFAPDMIEKWMDRNAVYMNCKMPTQYFGTSFIGAGAPEWFDLQIKFDLKEGDVTYVYDYEANWVDNGYYENRHHGEGRGDYIGDGWFTGVEQNTVLWYQYYLNTQTGEQISSGPEETTTTYNFIGTLFDDLSQAVFCRAYGNTNDEIKSVGKKGLLNWNTSLCNPCTVDIK
jgi:hypothetical protein